MYLSTAKGCVTAALALCSIAAQAQSCGFVGLRTIKSYWIEGNTALVVVPTQDFDNPTGCTRFNQAFVLTSNPAYKPILAAVMQAMATNTPIQAYACGCHTYWSGLNWPIIGGLGVGGGPQ